jgi:hypothetical protein
MSEVHGDKEDESTEMILNHDGFILVGKKRKRDSSPMMSEYTLNGRFLSM